jgi:hypothetical protein
MVKLFNADRADGADLENEIRWICLIGLIRGKNRADFL